VALSDVLSPNDVAVRSNGTVDIGDQRLTPYLSDVLAEAAMFAPCLQNDDVGDLKTSQARAILCDAVLRRFARDNLGPESTQVQTETYTMGPATKSVTFANGSPLGLPLLTQADRDFLTNLCRSKRPSMIPIVIPTIHDPNAAGYNQVPRGLPVDNPLPLPIAPLPPPPPPTP
jgi:hypothetical protein